MSFAFAAMELGHFLEHQTRMQSGIRTVRSATLQITETTAIPERMRSQVREVSHLEVPIEDRRKGYASELLKRVCDEANACAMVLLLLPDEAQDWLISFYERFGFVRIQDSPPIMARTPVIKSINLAL